MKFQASKPLNDKLRDRLQGIATSTGATIISFVAPRGVRTSPITFASASIEEKEIYRLETIVRAAVEKAATKCLHLVIHTPGGEMHASYKIARYLRSKFTKICAYVPYEAASGGTILCCGANELYISELGSLTSFDPQVRYKNTRVAANAFVRSVESIEDRYGEMSPAEIPSPWQQMSDKLDPVIYDEMSTALLTSKICAWRLLERSGYDKKQAISIAQSLADNMYTHEFPFFADEVKQMGLNVLEAETGIMDTYRDLVSCRLGQESPSHVIDSFYPENQPSTVTESVTKIPASSSDE